MQPKLSRGKKEWEISDFHTWSDRKNAKYIKDGFQGYLGILGPKRMNYAYNIVLLEEIKKLFNES